MALMTTAQAAHRLGVKPQTLYAYVSRGLLRSHRAPDGRGSRFDRAEVEALARRGRPRATSRSATLAIEVASRITSMGPDGLRYRGHDVAGLARSAAFEQVAGLIWTGGLAAPGPPWTARAVPSRGRTMGERLVSICAAVPAEERPRTDPEAVAAEGRRLITTVVESLPRLGDGPPPLLHLPAGGPPLRGTVAARLWSRLTPRRPRTGGVACLNAALVLLADHEMAASTLAARVAASTRAEARSVVLAGLGTLAGPYHGGASRQVRRLLDDARRDGPGPAADRWIERTGGVPGFGHAVYRDDDPRAVVLLDLLDRHVDDRHRALAEAVLGEVRRRSDEPVNVDFALGLAGSAFDMTDDAGEAIFAVARISGWLGHAIEEYAERPLRYRARAVYVGDPPLD
jgi:citrate synthase